MLNGPQAGHQSGANTDLGIQIVEMKLDGLFGNPKFGCNGFIGPARQDQSENLLFT